MLNWLKNHGGSAVAKTQAHPVQVNPAPRSNRGLARNYARIGRLRLRLRDPHINSDRRATMEAELMRRVGGLRQAKHTVPEDPDACLRIAADLMEHPDGSQ